MIIINHSVYTDCPQFMSFMLVFFVRLYSTLSSLLFSRNIFKFLFSVKRNSVCLVLLRNNDGSRGDCAGPQDHRTTPHMHYCMSVMSSTPHVLVVVVVVVVLLHLGIIHYNRTRSVQQPGRGGALSSCTVWPCLLPTSQTVRNSSQYSVRTVRERDIRVQRHSVRLSNTQYTAVAPRVHNNTTTVPLSHWWLLGETPAENIYVSVQCSLCSCLRSVGDRHNRTVEIQ